MRDHHQKRDHPEQTSPTHSQLRRSSERSKKQGSGEGQGGPGDDEEEESEDDPSSSSTAPGCSPTHAGFPPDSLVYDSHNAKGLKGINGEFTPCPRGGVVLPLTTNALFTITKVDKTTHSHPTWDCANPNPHKSCIHKGSTPPKLYERAEEGIIRKAHEIAKERGGECLSLVCIGANQLFTYKCHKNHIWKSDQVISQGKWCPLCEDYMLIARQLTQNIQGQFMTGRIENELEFECKLGHIFKIRLSYLRKCKKECPKCREIKEGQKKEYQEEWRIKREKADQEQQREMFSQAKEQMRYMAVSKEQEKIRAFAQLEFEINSRSERQTREYLVNENRTNSLYPHIYVMFKVLYSPLKLLAFKMTQTNQEQRDREFRQFAKYLHPDKNSHPNAAQAFQKVSSIYKPK